MSAWLKSGRNHKISGSPVAGAVSPVFYRKYWLGWQVCHKDRQCPEAVVGLNGWLLVNFQRTVCHKLFSFLPFVAVSTLHGLHSSPSLRQLCSLKEAADRGNALCRATVTKATMIGSNPWQRRRKCLPSDPPNWGYAFSKLCAILFFHLYIRRSTGVDEIFKIWI